MPVLRSVEERRPNTRFMDFLMGSSVNSLLGEGEPASPNRPNMAARRRLRGGSQATGASTTLVQTATSLTPDTGVLAAETEESHSGRSTSGVSDVTDGMVAMGLANADLASDIRSLRITMMALFSVLTTGQLRRLKEQHADEQDEMLKAMIEHSDSCVLARAAAQGGIDGNSNLNGSRQQGAGAVHDVEDGGQPPAAAAAATASASNPSVVPMTTANAVTSPRATTTTSADTARTDGTGTADGRAEIERRLSEQRRADDDRRAAQQREFERRDAEKRKYNVIIHGVHETDQRGDKDAIYQMLSHLNCAFRYHQIENNYRLGRRHFRKKRMLLITFNNKAAVREILDKGPRLGRSRLFDGIFIREDIPVAQRQTTRHNSRLHEASQGPRGEHRNHNNRSREASQDSRSESATPNSSRIDFDETEDEWPVAERPVVWPAAVTPGRNNDREANMGNGAESIIETPRNRRLSIVSHSTDESDGSDIESNTETESSDDSDSTREDTPRYITLNGEQYLITDSYVDSSSSNEYVVEGIPLGRGRTPLVNLR